ncbi:MAG: DUF1080 domain-containing protein [Verrucomicrobiaceae bacterium]|nr:DUF1080 domain-containing protein [Verrucomicrobiaceae bacterium]
MKLSLLFVLTVSIVASAQTGEWVSLFDGKSFAGWSQPGGKAPEAGWMVEDGMIHLKGKGGNLITEKQYGTFELEWEWKLAEGANNGVKYWVVPIGEKKEYLGIEYQMIDDKRHQDALRGGSHTTACIYDIKEAVADKPVKPAGEWNVSKIVVKGTKLEHWLNGMKVAEADTASQEWKDLVAKSKFKSKPGFAPGKGHIMLTDHQDETWYRSIRIKELQ